ncbi:MAG TPA: gephyrin-like molybdotransferase Glp [Gammaproteobacteria bacterium]|nr:gephyrin-like molybdotransferase Glp [Gammaproteobacteria bacterium]
MSTTAKSSIHTAASAAPGAASCRSGADPQSLPVDAARERILAALSPVADNQMLPLRAALGRVLAEEVLSPIDVPAHTNSAVDGYAVSAAELPAAGTTELRVVATARAGHPVERSIGPGECVQIMTGAPMPPGADTALMQEDVQRSGDIIVVNAGHRGGENVRRAGEDLAAGQPAVHAGQRLMPAQLGLLASLGRAEVRVRRRPRVAFFSTGDELRSVGQPLGPGEIYDSNRYSLHGMISRLDMDILDLGVVTDHPERLREALRTAAREADAIVTSGGVSVGEADYIKQILAELGEVDFWKIAMKPGRPFAFGRVDDAWFFGLPGNPVAVMVTFYQFVQPALERLAGRSPGAPPTLQAIAAEPLRKKPGRTEFVRAVLETDADGRRRVRPSGPQGSGILRSMSEADCFIVLGHDSGPVADGDVVEVQPFAGLV